jgi:hypothetical protein
MTLKYRVAEKEDCAKLAEFLNIASDGVVEYLFHELVPGMEKSREKSSVTS